MVGKGFKFAQILIEKIFIFVVLFLMADFAVCASEQGGTRYNSEDNFISGRGGVEN
ncbi:MAG TPA: hypothetical protein VJJ52_04915 [Candidatus Nanoarchaeia archaeon]|nr:hypothetical protein [Candidatus Nanoarchaeia archaeon]